MNDTEHVGLPDRKQAIRREVRARRAEVARDALVKLSRLVTGHVTALPEFEAAKVVCCFLSMPWEPQTAWLIEACRRDGKKVCVPACRGEGEAYGLSVLPVDGALVKRAHGVREPAVVAWVPLEDVDLMVVPGVAFDGQCGRLGRGGGHYDRVAGAAGGERVFKVGLAFDWQMVERVPVGKRDVRMDAVVTETRTIRRET